MNPNQYAALAEAVEHGLYRGWDQVHEHTPRPKKDKLLHALLSAIMVDLDQLIRRCAREEAASERADDEGIIESLRKLAAYQHADVSVAADAADLITALLEARK